VIGRAEKSVNPEPWRTAGACPEEVEVAAANLAEDAGADVAAEDAAEDAGDLADETCGGEILHRRRQGPTRQR